MRWLQKLKLLMYPELGLVGQLARQAHIQVGAVQMLRALVKGVSRGPGGEGPELCQECATNPLHPVLGMKLCSNGSGAVVWPHCLYNVFPPALLTLFILFPRNSSGSSRGVWKIGPCRRNLSDEPNVAVTGGGSLLAGLRSQARLPWGKPQSPFGMMASA